MNFQCRNYSKTSTSPANFSFHNLKIWVKTRTCSYFFMRWPHIKAFLWPFLFFYSYFVVLRWVDQVKSFKFSHIHEENAILNPKIYHTNMIALQQNFLKFQPVSSPFQPLLGPFLQENQSKLSVISIFVFSMKFQIERYITWLCLLQNQISHLFSHFLDLSAIF